MQGTGRGTDDKFIIFVVKMVYIRCLRSASDITDILPSHFHNKDNQ